MEAFSVQNRQYRLIKVGQFLRRRSAQTKKHERSRCQNLWTAFVFWTWPTLDAFITAVRVKWYVLRARKTQLYTSTPVLRRDHSRIEKRSKAEFDGLYATRTADHRTFGVSDRIHHLSSSFSDVVYKDSRQGYSIKWPSFPVYRWKRRIQSLKKVIITTKLHKGNLRPEQGYKFMKILLSNYSADSKH